MKKSINQVKSLDHSLDLIERVVLYNLSLYEKFDDKTIFIQKYYNNLINEVFNQKKYVVETYKSKFSNKFLVESKSDINEIIGNIHNFIKRAIEFDTLFEQYAQKPSPNQPTTGIQPQQKRAVTSNEPYQGTQMGPSSNVNQGVKVKLNNIPAVKLKQLGIDGYFENMRQALYSTPGAISQGLLTLIGPGKVTVAVIWGALSIYDAYKYFKQGLKKHLSKLIADIVAILVNFAIPSITDIVGIVRFLKSFSIAESLTLQGLAKLLGKILGKQVFLKFLLGLSSGMQLFFSLLEKGFYWIEQTLNINLGSDTISKCKEITEDFKIACEEIAEKEGLPKKTPIKKPIGVDRSMDIGKI